MYKIMHHYDKDFFNVYLSILYNQRMGIFTLAGAISFLTVYTIVGHVECKLDRLVCTKALKGHGDFQKKP